MESSYSCAFMHIAIWCMQLFFLLADLVLKEVEFPIFDFDRSGSEKKLFQNAKNFFASPEQGAIRGGAYL
jgi:hypothetical protein